MWKIKTKKLLKKEKIEIHQKEKRKINLNEEIKNKIL